MIRQPDFVDSSIFEQFRRKAREKAVKKSEPEGLIGFVDSARFGFEANVSTSSRMPYTRFLKKGLSR